MVEDEEIYNKIMKLYEMGNEYENTYKYEKAIKKYQEALELLDEDVEEYEVATLLYTAIGDVFGLLDKYNEAKKWYYDAMNCPNGIANPYILFKLGECFYMLDDIKKSKEYFLKTYMLDGMSLFEEFNIEYYNIIKEFM